MHTRFLLTFNKEKAETSEEARAVAITYLCENGFVETQTRWGYGLGDWFVVGGRWSGELSRFSWGTDLYNEMDALEDKHGVRVQGTFYGKKEMQTKQAELEVELNRLWRERAPQQYQDIPIKRDTYLMHGYEDDAMLLTKELYDGLLKAFEGSADSDIFADIEYDDMNRDAIGKKWVVVIDYHC